MKRFEILYKRKDIGRGATYGVDVYAKDFDGALDYVENLPSYVTDRCFDFYITGEALDIMVITDVELMEMGLIDHIDRDETEIENYDFLFLLAQYKDIPKEDQDYVKETLLKNEMYELLTLTK